MMRRLDFSLLEALNHSAGSPWEVASQDSHVPVPFSPTPAGLNKFVPHLILLIGSLRALLDCAENASDFRHEVEHNLHDNFFQASAGNGGAVPVRPNLSWSLNMSQPTTVPARAWVVTFAGTAVNLCLGILYAWSVWKANLVADDKHPAGSPMAGLNEGWSYLTNAEATWAYALCGFIFALAMIPGGRLQDRYGPKLGATLGGLFLAGGCVLAGLMRSYTGLILGFGV